MNPPKIADYTTRKSYQQNYARDNREAINARKREWRLARKNLSSGEGHHEQRASSNAQSAAIGNETSLSQNPMNPTLSALFPNMSKSCRDANPDVPATLIPKSDKNETKVARKAKKRGLPNKTESEFGLYLEALKRRGEILRYDFQGLTLRWQCGDDIIRYTPDFVVFYNRDFNSHSQTLKLIEVKGGYTKMPGYLERAVERFRHARTFWPQFQFELHKKTKDGWKKVL